MIAVTGGIQLAEHEIEVRYVTAAGPGGQNVNRTAMAAHLRFDASGSPSLPDDLKRRLRSVAGRRMSSAGVVTIKAQRFRSQERNRQDAIDRLVGLLRRAASPPSARRAASPGPQAVEQRLDEKHRRARTKQSRAPVDDEE